MAITSIQPIMSFSVSGFSAVMQATATSPPQLLSVTTQTVTTPSASTVVTLGTLQPLSQPLFNANGQLTGTTDNLSGTSIATADRLIDANLALAGSAAPDLTALDTTGLGAANVLGAPIGTTGAALNRSLAADVQTAIAGLDANGPRTIGTVDLANPNAAPLGAATTPAVTGATAPATSLPNEAAQNAAAVNAQAVSGAATGPTITATPPAIPATAQTNTAAAATPTAATGTPATPPATSTPATVTATATVPGNEATAALQRLVNDATTRAIGNLSTPAYANIAATLYVSAGVFRALNDTTQPMTGVGTADTAGAPPTAVTAPRTVQPV